MTNKNDGGPAFPSGGQWQRDGMTLRDWFAGQALSGVMRAAIQQRDDTTIYWTDVAEHAYGLADAMLAERDRA